MLAAACAGGSTAISVGIKNRDFFTVLAAARTNVSPMVKPLLATRQVGWQVNKGLICWVKPAYYPAPVVVEKEEGVGIAEGFNRRCSNVF